MKSKRAFTKWLTDYLDSLPLTLTKNEKGSLLYYGVIPIHPEDKLYKDELSRIFESEDPWEHFYKVVSNAWQYAEDEEMDALEDKIRGEFPEFLRDKTDEEKAELEEYFMEFLHSSVVFDAPYEHYLKQKYPVNIIMDTGDGNYDYVLNCIKPAFDGTDDVPEKASIAWLAETQGYSREVLQAALQKGDISPESVNGFLDSVRQELANVSTHMNAVTFFVEMTLEDLLNVNEALCKNTAGSLTLKKETMTGLFDPWNGAGGPLEIELEKDVIVPFEFIRSIRPDMDTESECSAARVYGMSSGAWKDTLLNYTIENNEKEEK